MYKDFNSTPKTEESKNNFKGDTSEILLFLLFFINNIKK